ncbi:MAG: UvrD-helicase domain-containing protein [Clostridia bacterium]|nr:UvrD-helicase domain-containing protein [Clostridia bacterium]
MINPNELKLEQRDAIFNHDGSDLIVSASAGCGKTFVMVNRIIRLILENKLSVNELLAVTFTEKAADEMKDRLSEALIDSIISGNVSLRQDLLDLPMADICTIDAFCSRLVKRYFYEIGISRDFEVISEADAFRLMTEALKMTFDKFYLESSPDFLRVIDRFSKYRKDATLRDYVKKIYEVANSEADPDAWLDLAGHYYTAQGLEELEQDYLLTVKDKISQEIRVAENLKRIALDKGIASYADNMDVVIDELNDLLKANSIYEYAGLEVTLGGKIPTVKFSPEDESFKKKFQSKRSGIKERLNKLFATFVDKNAVRSGVLSTKTDYEVIKNLVKDYANNYFNLKKEENKFDFNDIERFALNLLRIEEVGKAVRQKYKNIFIDEYQDVNGVQEEIFSLLATDNEFMVGDVKQSIYGFRGCNPTLFDNKQKLYKAQNKSLLLNYNFRSAPEVLHKVNDIFDRIITPDTFGIDYKSTARLVHGGFYPEHSGRVKLHTIIKPKVDKKELESKIYDIVEAASISEIADDDYTTKKVLDIIKSELNKEYYHTKDKVYKKVTLSDITILCRKKDQGIISLIKGLTKNGIGVVSDVESSVLEYKEVKLLIELLKLIDCFYQDSPLAICLLSKIGGLTPNELATVRSEGNKKLNPENSKDIKVSFCDCFDEVKNHDTELGKKLKAFDDYVKKLRRMADFKGARYVLDTVIKDKNLSAYALIDKLGTMREKRVERFLSETSLGGNELSVRDFLYKIENSPKSFTITETAGGEAVTIMTMHKSKGLDFPVVIIVGCEKKFNFKDIEGNILIDRHYGFVPCSFDDVARITTDNIFFEQVKAYITKKTCQDEARVFYVATTRAKYSMHLVSVEGEVDDFSRKTVADAKRFYEFLPEDFPKEVYNKDDNFKFGEFDNQPITSDALENDANGKIIIGMRNEDLISKIKDNLTYIYPYLEDVDLKLKTSVTANLTGEDFTIKDLLEEEVSSIPAPVHRGTVTAEEGIIAHKVLEGFDFSSLDNVSGEISRLVKNGVITANERSILDEVRLAKTLQNDIFKEIIDYKLYKEQYFVTNIPANMVLDGVNTAESVLMQGVIDLLAVKDDKAIIIDYKYSGKSKDSLLKTYAKQLKLYKYAVETSLQVKVIKTAIVSLLSGETVVVEED